MKHRDYEEKFKSLVDTYLKDHGLEGLDELILTRFDTDAPGVRIEGNIHKLDLYFVYKILLGANAEWLFVYRKLGGMRRTYTREFADNLEVLETAKVHKFYYDNGGVSWAKDHPSLEEDDD